LDFDDFKRFVKLLKARPEVKRLYEKLCSLDKGSFSFQTFEHFMRDYQKVSERVIRHFKSVSYVLSSRTQTSTN
jgi:hypothetical protein